MGHLPMLTGLKFKKGDMIMKKKFLAILLALSITTPILAADYTHSYNQDGRGDAPIYTISDVVEIHNGTTKWERDGEVYDLTTLTVTPGSTVDLEGMYLIQCVPVTLNSRGVFEDSTSTINDLIAAGSVGYYATDNSEEYFKEAASLYPYEHYPDWSYEKYKSEVIALGAAMGDVTLLDGSYLSLLQPGEYRLHIQNKYSSNYLGGNSLFLYVVDPAVEEPVVVEPAVEETDFDMIDISIPSEVYEPDIYAPETYPQAYEPDVYVPEVYTPEVYTPEVYTPEVYVPEVYTPEVYTPEVYAPEATYVDYTPVFADMYIHVNSLIKTIPVCAIDGYNYVSIRDFSNLLNTTTKGFSVNWNNGLVLESYNPHSPKAITHTFQSATEVSDPLLQLTNVTKDKQVYTMETYVLDGIMHFRLEDLSTLFGVKLTWDDIKGTTIISH